MDTEVEEIERALGSSDTDVIIIDMVLNTIAIEEISFCSCRTQNRSGQFHRVLNKEKCAF